MLGKERPEIVELVSWAAGNGEGSENDDYLYGRKRQSCIMRLRRALEEMVVEGVKNNIPLHQALIQQDDVLSGDYSI